MNSGGDTSSGVAHLSEKVSRLLKAEIVTLTAVLDLVDDAIAVLDASSLVLHANRSARALFDRNIGVSLAPDGRLAIADRQAADSMRAALSRLSFNGQVPPTAAESRERTIVSKRDGLPLILTLHALEARQEGINPAVAILFVCDPESRPGGHAATLKLIYGLTPGEVKLVQALNEGLTLKEFSDWSGLSYETVRSYLKRVLSKTGAHSQTDLVRLTQSLG